MIKCPKCGSYMWYRINYTTSGNAILIGYCSCCKYEVETNAYY